MKTCKICNAVAFDDAVLCFGCMSRFDDGGESTEVTRGVTTIADAVSSADAVPAFYIRLAPDRQPDGTMAWSCSVALA